MKTTQYRYDHFLATMFVLLCINASAQDVDEIRKRYPGENAVVLNKVLHYKIDVRDGQPHVESKQSEKLLYLNTNLSYMGRYSFYHSTFHEVQEYSAYTQTAANKKVKVTDFKTSNSSSGSVFYDDAKETKFDFPSLSPGAVGNIELSVNHTKPYLLTPYYFYRYIPVIKTELKITASNDIGLKYQLKGLDTSMIKVKVDKRRNETTYTFYAENLDATKQYSDAPDESWYEPHVVFYIDHYTNAQGENVKYLSGVEDLYKLNSSFISTVNRVPGTDLSKLVDSITRNTSDDVEKTKRIYQWVQKHIKYIAFEDGMGGFVPRDANIILHRRYGDCKDMASLLTMMLNTAGIKAYYTWIGTRDIAYTYNETPLPIVDNHMICTATPGGKVIFLDGTDPSCVFGSIPIHIQDKEAMVGMGPNDYKIMKVPVQGMDQNLQTDSTFIEIDNNGIKGKIRQDLKGYYATNMQYLLSHMDSKDQKEKIKSNFSRGSNKFQLNDFSIGDRSNMNELRMDVSFSLNDYAKKSADEWFINMNLLRPYQGEEIDFPKRKMPVAFDFLYSNRYVVTLKIPDGYTASYVPKGKSYENELWGFDIDYKVAKDVIIYTLKFHSNRLMIGVGEFEKWNKVLEQLNPLYKEIVILSKK
jgi:transglutaminase-like putative cysteine protease